jgi:hypothetical protein
MLKNQLDTPTLETMGNHCHWIDKIEIATLVVTPTQPKKVAIFANYHHNRNIGV